ncbi:MAG: EF-hand domain-containing protein [Gallionella sp.]
MSSAICGSGGCSSTMGGMNGMQRPDPSKMTDKLFSKLDTKGQGYLEKSDFKSVFNQASSTGSSNSSSKIDDVFKAMDVDGNGKVTKQEMTDSVKQVTDQLVSQLQNMRMSGNGGSTQQTTESPKSFNAADSNQDGEISAQEAIAYQKTNASTSSANSAQNSDGGVMLRIMELAKSYGVSAPGPQSASSISALA